MSAATYTALRCDERGCVASWPPAAGWPMRPHAGNARSARTSAAAEGWRCGGGVDLCPLHNPDNERPDVALPAVIVIEERGEG